MLRMFVRKIVHIFIITAIFSPVGVYSFLKKSSQTVLFTRTFFIRTCKNLLNHTSKRSFIEAKYIVPLLKLHFKLKNTDQNSLVALENILSQDEVPPTSSLAAAWMCQIAQVNAFHDYCQKYSITAHENLGNGLTPLHYASSVGNHPIVQYLLENNACSNQRTEERDMVKIEFPSLQASFVSYPLNGESSLHLAYDPVTVELLIQGGADVLQNNNLHQSVLISTLKFHALHFLFLMQIRGVRNTEKTFTECESSAYSLLERFIQYGAKPKSFDIVGDSAITYAQKFKFKRCEQLLNLYH